MAAASDLEIAAVVGDDVISNLDVKNRTDMAIASSGLQPSAEIKERLFPQIIQTLIDERLYVQEAKRLNITLSQADVDAAVSNLEMKNKIKPGTFKNFIKDKNIPYESVIDQLKAQILWGKIVNKRIRSKVSVTEREVEETTEHISHSSGVSELNVFEIVLPVENEKDSAKVRGAAQKLVAEIRKGADFSAVAKEFSRSTTAQTGGDLGWMSEEHLPKDILPRIRNLQIGEVSEPFLVNNSYHVVKLNDRRALVSSQDMDGEVQLKQAMVQIPEGSSDKTVKDIASNLNKKMLSFKSCDSFGSFAKDVNSVLDSQTIKTKISDLNGDIQGAIASTPQGKLTPLISTSNGFYIFAVCKKPQTKNSVVMKDKVNEIVLRKKLEVQAQQYLRNLRKNTLIEIRS
ncbi:MAG: putative peptidyl-prolyl cis-trans isomerase family protein [Rickettsiaceae bacterium]|jgi:peptidyl-prolyl cis-trans isomerase SurA|nr:putative peptidyl-prolyl cis-trans isomerase family protein [Rickettsiaceae bacterium]